MVQSVPFQFSWKALHLLGKSLYSNAWSAISELVANGFDANAQSVFVLIDAKDKKNSVIEILDDGAGMSDDDILTYVKVGYDKREDAFERNNDTLPSKEIMGRKDIGKLAALFLSNNYFIQTKTSSSTNTWNLCFDESTNPNDTPSLTKMEDSVICSGIPIWNDTPTGTLLSLQRVNLSGLGDVAFKSLSTKLANQFLLTSLDGRKIQLCVLEREICTTPVFCDVEKSIAFRNLAYIAKHYPTENNTPPDILGIEKDRPTIKVPYPSISDEYYEHEIELGSLSDIADANNPITGFYAVQESSIDADKLALRDDIERFEDGTIGIPYEITGWIGFHSTIEGKTAKANDIRFIKNQFYNPAQIRLYVRNKLATENILDKLGLTQAFVNYIEGEISFDLLDDDLLPDIATSSRQGFDELDGRWELLRKILRPMVRNLITKRGNLAKMVRANESDIKGRRETAAKTKSVDNFKSQVEEIPGLKKEQKERLTEAYASQLKGDVDAKAKTDYTIFISHQRKDKAFTDFIYNLLKFRGAVKEDFFYTSADDRPDRYEKIEPLQDQIRRNITSENTLLTYFTSAHFRESEYCLFEAGAGWATRSIGAYEILSTTFDDIPNYLTNAKTERCLKANGPISLDRETYGLLVPFLNNLILHINKGREITGSTPVALFCEVDFPDKVELNRGGKNDIDYMDPDIVRYWKTYVEPCLADYEKSLAETRALRQRKSSVPRKKEGTEE